MNKKLFILILAILLILSLIFPTLKDPSKPSQACINQACFSLEIADTLQVREIGLSNHQTLSQDSGMLFVFPEPGNYPFWMKDMSFPIDIIWISQDLKVAHIKQNALPCQLPNCVPINPQVQALYVLEINSGLTEKHSISLGDKVSLEL